ncbi:MAG: ROK family protein [Bifidobacteriaceae bacterium]|jgi:predicted NBD/HSP70 family sugar kinase|nr:ROK family protein [Bifidobacteriaceae bacterium]
MSTTPTSAHGLLLGIDVGGTKIEGVLVATSDDASQSSPAVLACERVDAHPGERNVVAGILTVVTALTARAEDFIAEHGPLLSIGIGTPGKVDSGRGTVENIANLRVSFLDLVREIGDATGLPVHVENDVNAAAVGAAALLGGAQSGVIAFLNLGTGLAAGILRNGILDQGFSGAVGEIGHVPVEPHRLPCPCGQSGCLETMASGGAVARMWPYDNPPMPAIIATAHNTSFPEHDEAQEILTNVVAAIVDAIDILAVTVDPRTIIVGGGMAKTGDPLLQEITGELNRRAAQSPFIASLDLPSRLRLAPSDAPSGAVGAALSGIAS